MPSKTQELENESNNNNKMPSISRTKSAEYLTETDAARLLAKKVKLPFLRTDMTNYRTAINPQTIDDFTPTTIEACRRTGVDPVDLLPTSTNNSEEHPTTATTKHHSKFQLESLIDLNDPETSPSALKKKLGKSKSVVLKLRQKFIESERIATLQMIDQERNLLLDQGWTPDQQQQFPASPALSTMNATAYGKSLSFRTSRTQISTRNNSPLHSSTSHHHAYTDELEREFYKKEQKRHRSAIRKQNHVNKLLLEKLKRESEQERKKLLPARSDKEINAIKRHEQYLNDIKNVFHQRNKTADDKSHKAFEKKKLKREKKLAQTLATLEELDERAKKLEELHDKENRDFRLKQDIRFEHHHLKFNKIRKEQKKHRKAKYKHLKKRQSHAINKVQLQNEKMAMIRREQSEHKEIKIRENIEKVKTAEQHKRDVLELKIRELNKKILNVEKQKEAIKNDLKQHSSNILERVEKVNNEKEKEISEKYDKLEKKEKMLNMKQEYLHKQKEAKKLLNYEMSKLERKHRLLQRQRKEQREEYRRQMIEQKMREKEEKINAMQRAKQKVIEKHRYQTNKTRLLREEANYQFEHLRADTIKNPESMKKFVELFQRQLSC